MGLTIQEINLVRAHLEKNDNAFLTDLQALETFTRNPAAYRLCIGKDGHLWNQDIHVDVLTRIFHCFQRFFLEKSFNSEEERKEFLLAKGKADANLALWLGREANLKVEIKETDELPVQLRKAREIGEIAWEKLKQNPPFFVPRSEPLANVEKVKSVQPIESDSERLQRKMNRLVEEAMRCLFVDPQRFQQIITEVSQQYLSFGSEDQVVERRVCIDFFRDLWRKLEWEINKNPHNRDLKIKMLAFCVCAESLLDELNATEKNEEISQLSRHFRLRRGEILDI
ncbi:MAG TPA: hypothetical protein VHL30_03875, partial [Chlamydiales bacterium]|nr:hypothetical protein [Chlamydiales bacterium]